MAWPLLVMSLLWLIYSSCKAAHDYASFRGGGDDDKLARAPTVFFHVILLTASGLMAMTLLSWTLSGTQGRFELDRGTTSMWMKMASQWLCVALYGAACMTSIRQAREVEFSIFNRRGFF